MRQPTSVPIFDERVNDALGVYDDVDVIGIQIEEPARLDDLEALVQQGRRVHADLGAHLPGRVGERLLGCGGLHLLERGLAEGSPRSGQHDPSQGLTRVPGETLLDRHVFGIERHDARTRALGFLEHELPGRHEDLLVRERHLGAAAERGEDRLQTEAAHQRPDHEVTRLGGHLDQALRAVDDADGGVRQGLPQTHRSLARVDRDQARAELLGLLQQELHVGTGGQRRDLESIPEPPDDVQGLGPDRAGRTEDADGLHEPFRICAPVRPKRRSRRW